MRQGIAADATLSNRALQLHERHTWNEYQKLYAWHQLERIDRKRQHHERRCGWGIKRGSFARGYGRRQRAT